ncbi:Homeodomain-like domain [Actinobacteria bacterium IMCC26256]|nr:Homeodomain-like domain [Actinobacteria bacterium IMCC26256]
MSTPREQEIESTTPRPGQRKGATKQNPTDFEIDQRRLQVGRLLSEKVPQSEIAECLGISRSTLTRDLTAIKAEWRSQVRVQYTEAIAQEIATLDELERRIWVTHLNAFGDDSVSEFSLKAVGALLSIKDRRYRLLGLVGTPKPEIRPVPTLTREEHEEAESAMFWNTMGDYLGA